MDSNGGIKMRAYRTYQVDSFTKEKLLGNGRPKRIVIPRQIAMYLCRNELHESYPTLRDCFKRKDHSTVLYACERVENDMAKDPQTRAAIEAIRKMLPNR